MNTFTDTKHCWIRDSSARNIGEFTFCMCDTHVFCVTETQTYRNMKIKTTSTQWRRLFCQFPLGISSSVTFWSLSKNVGTNNVLLVKIEGSVWYTIYHQLPIDIGVKQTPLLIKQPLGKGHLWGKPSSSPLGFQPAVMVALDQPHTQWAILVILDPLRKVRVNHSNALNNRSSPTYDTQFVPK